MGATIHPSAVIDKTAKLGSDVTIGPFAIIEAGAEIGDGTIVDANVIVGKNVKIGKNNRLFANCVIGRPPQVLNFNKPAGSLTIGDGNTIREFVTIHPSMYPDHGTVIGNNNLLMIGVHLGHDCHLGDQIVMSNYTQISGHCHVQTGVWLSGMVAVHQFCTIRTKWCYAAGYTGIAHDIPPFMIVSGHYPSEVRGVNKRGVRRAGLNEQQQEQIEHAYRFIWRTKKPVLEQVKALAQKDGIDDNVKAIIELMLNMGKQRFGRHLELYRDKNIIMYRVAATEGGWCIMKKIRTAIVGAGKMGGIHAKVYGKLEEAQLVAVVDMDLQRAQNLAAQHNCQAFSDPKELLGKVDAVTISAPTVAHKDLAELFISNHIPVLIEKPLASSVEEGRRIVELSKKYNTVVAVGHSERCNPVVQAMKRLHIEPMFIESTRVSPYPFRSMDIGVVLDVMIHDIDIILSLADSPVKKVEAVGVNVIADHEDICNARVTFENGCIANITASRLALKTERKVRIFSRQAYLSLDYHKKTGVVIKTDPNVDVVKWIREHQEAQDFDFSTVNWTEMLHMEQLDITEAEPLKVEQQAFLKAVVDSSCRPEVTAEEGLAALECAEKILACVRQHHWR